jgi:hypothetical protein
MIPRRRDSVPGCQGSHGNTAHLGHAADGCSDHQGSVGRGRYRRLFDNRRHNTWGTWVHRGLVALAEVIANGGWWGWGYSTIDRHSSHGLCNCSHGLGNRHDDILLRRWRRHGHNLGDCLLLLLLGYSRSHGLGGLSTPILGDRDGLHGDSQAIADVAR